MLACFPQGSLEPQHQHFKGLRRLLGGGENGKQSSVGSNSSEIQLTVSVSSLKIRIEHWTFLVQFWNKFFFNSNSTFAPNLIGLPGQVYLAVGGIGWLSGSQAGAALEGFFQS